MKIIFYRYEKEDGGGPYFTYDGVNRITGERFDDDTLDGALTINSLISWFNNHKEKITEDYHIFCYYGEMLRLNKKTQVGTFKKSNAYKIGRVFENYQDVSF